MQLKKIDILEFKKVIYGDYKKIFPSMERKSYRTIKRLYKNNMTEIIEIVQENEIVGFIIINTIEDNLYAILDYFAILPKYQGKGYGTEAIKLLKEMYKEYNGIYIEIEKIETAKTEEEMHIRKRRANFYENLGFIKMKFDLDLFFVIYSIYILPCKVDKFTDREAIDEIFKIYRATIGEKRTEKYCKLLEEEK